MNSDALTLQVLLLAIALVMAALLAWVGGLDD